MISKTRCQKCYQKYTQANKPYIVCNRSHSICGECLTKVRRNNPYHDLRQTCPVCQKINPTPKKQYDNAMLLQQEIKINQQLMKEISSPLKTQELRYNDSNKQHKLTFQREKQFELHKKDEQKEKIKSIVQGKLNLRRNLNELQKKQSSQSSQIKKLQKDIDQYKQKVKKLQQQNALQDKMIKTLIQNNKDSQGINKIQKIKKGAVQQQQNKSAKNKRSLIRKIILNFIIPFALLGNFILQLLYLANSIIKFISNIASGLFFSIILGLLYALCIQILNRILTTVGNNNEYYKMYEEFVGLGFILIILLSSMMYLRQTFKIVKESFDCCSSSLVGRFSYYLQHLIYFVIMLVLIDVTVFSILGYFRPDIRQSQNLVIGIDFMAGITLYYVVPQTIVFLNSEKSQKKKFDGHKTKKQIKSE